MLMLISACGTKANVEENAALTMESSEENSNIVRTETDTELDVDSYVGEYNDYDVKEPNLEIQKKMMNHIGYKLVFSESRHWTA
jgi:hypothetical protein